MTSAQSLTLKAKGRFTSVNELSEVPEGALLEADDVDILQDGILEPRRGFELATDNLPDPEWRADSVFWFDGYFFAHMGTPYAADLLKYFDPDPLVEDWVDVDGVVAPSGTKIKIANSNQNIYLTTSEGIKVLDKFDGDLRLSGAYKGLDVAAATTGSSGWLDGGQSVAYRVVWGIKDSNGTLVLGAPSARAVVKNGASPSTFRDVIVTTTIPLGVTVDWIFQIYRSAQTPADEPSDDLQLVYEASPTSGDITAGSVSVTDIVPEGLRRGAALYTNASQEGLANGNERPPLARDLTVFNNCLFAANTVSKHRFNLTLISVGGSSGLQVNDTLTVGGITYTGKGSENIGAAEFQVVTGGTAAQNIKDTATSLLRVVNRHSLSTVNAFYMSDVDDLPGKILFEERSIGGAAFYVLSSRATCWNPSGIPTSGTTQASNNDTFVNGLAWSKPNQPESFPLVNFVQVGSKDSAILRIVALQEVLLIFKTDGIYRLTGFFPNFTVELLDSSAKLLGAETLAILNNRVFGLADQGVIEVSDGVRVISRPIETDLTKLFGEQLDDLKKASWGLAYESDRKYYLFVPDGSSEVPTLAHVYNVFTGGWVRHKLRRYCGTVYENRPYLADVDQARIYRERKSYTFKDYADFLADTMVLSEDENSVFLDSNADLARRGDVLFQSDEAFAIVDRFDAGTGALIVIANPGFQPGPAQLLKAIPCRVTWAPVTLANPGVQKQVHTATLFFKDDFYGSGSLGFKTDIVPSESNVMIDGFGLSVWGLFEWGEEPWGGEPIRRPARQWLPRDKQRSSQLIVSFVHSYAFSPWKLQGVSLFGDVGTEKITT